MTVEMTSKTTVRNLITSLLEMPMDSEVEICVRDNDKLHFADIWSIYTDEYNGKNTVVLTSK